MSSLGGLEIKKANEQGEWGLFIILYGKAGVGKTPLAAQAADSEYGSPVLFLDMEGGTRSISHRDDIDVLSIQSYDEYTKVTQELFRQTTLKWKTIVIDNGTELQNKHLKSILPDGKYPEIQHYGRNTAQLLSDIRNARDFAQRTHTNVIFIAWDNPDKEESTGITKNLVGFTPSLARQVPGMVDMIGYLQVVKGVRVLTFNSNDRNDAKFRKAPTEAASKIPGVLYYKNLEDMPFVDLLATLKGNKSFPAEKYAAPKS